ncbi:MAG: Na+/H+ antiporter subunit E [bacterium]
MGLLVANVLLMIVWVFLLEDLSTVQLFIGFALGYVTLYTFRGLLPDSSYFRNFKALIKFIGMFAYKNIKANFMVARTVLDPGYEMSPGFIKIDPEGNHPLELTWLAATISLIPGTLTVDTSEDDDYLYIHAMHVPTDEDGKYNPGEIRRETLEEIEPIILEIFD